MISMVYVSAAKADLPPNELERILETSRRNNARADVTGMLLFADESFIQVLEGDERRVTEVFDRLEGDPRHSGVIVVARYPISSRQFPDWSMGWRPLRHADPDTLRKGLSDLRDPIFLPDVEHKSSMAHRLLESFRDRSRD